MVVTRTVFVGRRCANSPPLTTLQRQSDGLIFSMPTRQQRSHERFGADAP
jgi:hypothetical protein